jgi:SAM-dependent methyltransferase
MAPKVEQGDLYLELTYGDKPFTTYPEQLTHFLAERFGMREGESLLDVGSGRGEFAQGFYDVGLKVTAIDQASPTLSRDNEINFLKTSLDDRIPFSDNSFDFVFSKSVVEHFYYPEKLIAELYRVLRPGGKIITMTPSWKHNHLMFFEDFTHRTPFTPESLRDVHGFAGFSNVDVEHFLQLPFVWEKRVLKRFFMGFGRVIPASMKSKSKTFRFAKEVMLLAWGTK